MSWFVAPLVFVRNVAHRLSSVGVARTAGSLAFTTLLGLVPLLAVAFGYVARLPLFDHWVKALESFLLRHLLPTSANAVVHTYIAEFTRNAAAVTGAGVAFLLITAFVLIATVEHEINAIWGSVKRRSWVKRLSVYLLGITFGPLLIGISISLTSWLVGRSLVSVPVATGYGTWLLKPVPFLITMLALTVLYKVIPVRRVPTVCAWAGGLFAAVLFETAKIAFARYVAHMGAYETVYGALAVLPLFLLWIYVSWIIVLVGAAITATLAEGPVKRRMPRSTR